MTEPGRGELSPTHRFGVLLKGYSAWTVPLGFLALAMTAGASGSSVAPAPSSGTFKATPLMAHPGCLSSCHSVHTAPVQASKTTSPGKFAKPRAPAPAAATGLDPICLGCHQGPKETADMGADKLPEGAGAVSRHIFDLGGRKGIPYVRTVESSGNRPRAVLRTDCSGCHDVHGKDQGPMLSPLAFDPHGQVMGGKPVLAAQVCFGCHAGTNAVVLSDGTGDIGALFSAGTASSHAMGRTASDRIDLPSLRNSSGHSRLDCTSCHGNPDSSGTPGPHYSSYPGLLKAAYAREQGSAVRAGTGQDLCYLCHDQHSIEADQSFSLHLEHLTGFVRTTGKALGRSLGVQAAPVLGGGSLAGRAPKLRMGFGQAAACATCHDPHGSRRYPHLIAFDPNVVSPSSVGRISYASNGFGRGTCTLTCHGQDHVQSPY